MRLLQRRRGMRTIALAVVSTFTLMIAAIVIFDEDWRVLFAYLLVALLGLLVIVIAALLLSLVLQLIRRWLS